LTLGELVIWDGQYTGLPGAVGSYLEGGAIV
jgi:hypothetical protein